MNDESIIRPNFSGLPAVRGTRLTVFSIMDHYLDGAGFQEIADFYRITVEEATAAIDYINSHMAELMPTYRQMLERDSQGNSPEVNELLRQSHEKLIARQADLKRQWWNVENAPLAG